MASVDHVADAKRSGMGRFRRPAKISDKPCCRAVRVLMQITPFALKAAFCVLLRFMHTMTVAGSSVRLQTAEAVKPHRPAGPSVVMMFTAAPRWAIASRKAMRSTAMQRAL